MRATILLVFYLGCSSNGDTIRMRVVGGGPVSIEQYPSTAAILRLDISGTSQICGGAILTTRHILTAAHCFKAPSTFHLNFQKYKVRVGSAYAHSGGSEHKLNLIMFHPRFHIKGNENDLSILRTVYKIVFSKTVQPAVISSSVYRLRDNESMWAVGWGETSEGGMQSEQLRHVEVKVISQHVCRTLYRVYKQITDNILCAGWLNGGGHDHCQRDSGSPLYHDGVVVGIASLGQGCGRPDFPGLNVRISRYAGWIQEMSKTSLIKD